MPNIAMLAFLAGLALAGAASAQDIKGTLTGNGKTTALAHAMAVEVDSSTEKGYMDVVVVLSDRKLTAAQASRLWALDVTASVRLLESMVEAGVLYRARDGAYLLLSAR